MMDIVIASADISLCTPKSAPSVSISVEDLAYEEDLVPQGVPKAPYNPDPPR